MGKMIIIQYLCLEVTVRLKEQAIKKKKLSNKSETIYQSNQTKPNAGRHSLCLPAS